MLPQNPSRIKPPLTRGVRVLWRRTDHLGPAGAWSRRRRRCRWLPARELAQCYGVVSPLAVAFKAQASGVAVKSGALRWRGGSPRACIAGVRVPRCAMPARAAVASSHKRMGFVVAHRFGYGSGKQNCGARAGSASRSRPKSETQSLKEAHQLWRINLVCRRIGIAP